MKTTKLLLLVNSVLFISLTLAACSPAAPIAAATAVPTATMPPTQAPTELPANFPTGKFVLPDNQFEGVLFNEDGTWSGFFAGEIVAEGTYSVKGDLYIEETNNQDCPVPMQYKYSFDGTNLTFQLTDQSKDDPCENRKQSFDGVTYILTK